ncbi:MAG: TonB-dependent receptor [Myxococcales bacterium]|nr:TonB-dependent receptor [Myxococcales bacterium]
MTDLQSHRCLLRNAVLIFMLGTGLGLATGSSGAEGAEREIEEPHAAVGQTAWAQGDREGEEPRWIPSIQLGFDAFEYNADSAVENFINPPAHEGSQSGSIDQLNFQLGAELMGPMFEGLPGQPRLFVQGGARYNTFSSDEIFRIGDIGTPEGPIKSFQDRLALERARGCETKPTITCSTAEPGEFSGQGSAIQADLSDPSWYASFGVAFNLPLSRNWLFQIKPSVAYIAETIDLTGELTTVTEPAPEIFEVHRSVANESSTDHSLGPGLELALTMRRSTRPITVSLYVDTRFMWLISDSTTTFSDSVASYRVDRDDFTIRGGAGLRFNWMGFGGRERPVARPADVGSPPKRFGGGDRPVARRPNLRSLRGRAGGVPARSVGSPMPRFAVAAAEETTGGEAPLDATSESSIGEADEAPTSGTDPDASSTDADDSSPDASEDLDSEAATAQADGMEEIVVTGEKTGSVVEDATISVIGFDPDVLKVEGIRDIRDLSNFTPSLEIQSAFAATNPTLFIRGVGLDDFNANSASAVAIYQDGVYMQSPAGQLFGFFDQEHVEVLRGPQGALYRNASAGAILVHSHKPSDEFEAYASTTYSAFDTSHFGDGWEVESAVGGPIIPDMLLGRVAGTWSIRDGLTRNRCAKRAPDTSPCNQKGGANQDIPVVEAGIDDFTNDIDSWAVRGQLLFTPPVVAGTEMEWLLSAHGGQNLGRAFQYQHTGVQFMGFTPDDPDIEQPVLPLGPGSDRSIYRDDSDDPFVGDYDIDGPEDLSLWGTSLKGNWKFGDGYELSSITAYEWNDLFRRENSDGNPKFLLISEISNSSWQVSQELNLRGEWGLPALAETDDGSWIVGAFYMQEDLDATNFYDQASGADLIQDFTQEMRNFAAYAQTEYELRPGCEPVPCDFTFLGGLRYNWEYKDFDVSACKIITANCGDTLVGREDTLWTGMSGEVSLSWHFYEDNALYLKYARGWKGGHFNAGATGRFDIITGVDPEIVDSYELGLRSFWFDDRLMLNLTGFYYDYQDLQVFQLEQTPAGFPLFQLVNASDALVYGVEIDLTASPLPGLDVTFHGSWVESEYLDFTVQLPFVRQLPSPPGQPPIRLAFPKDIDYSGNDLMASPRFAMTGSIGYEIPLPGNIGSRGLGFLTPRFSFSWKDDVFHDAGSGRGALLNFPKGTFGQEAFWLLNGSLAWRSEESRIEVIGWVHNFLDKHYKTQSFDLHRSFRILLDAYADPRTFGVTVTLTF